MFETSRAHFGPKQSPSLPSIDLIVTRGRWEQIKTARDVEFALIASVELCPSEMFTSVLFTTLNTFLCKCPMRKTNKSDLKFNGLGSGDRGGHANYFVSNYHRLKRHLWYFRLLMYFIEGKRHRCQVEYINQAPRAQQKHPRLLITLE